MWRSQAGRPAKPRRDGCETCGGQASHGRVKTGPPRLRAEPLLCLGHSPAQAQPARTVRGERGARNGGGPQRECGKVVACPGEGGAMSGAIRVLVVDDEKPLVDLLSGHLRREGYQALAAGDGLAALELARSAQPHVV